jgi:hypothetical protein
VVAEVKWNEKQSQIRPAGWLPNGLIKHTLPEPNGIIHCDTVWDVGAGIRPMNWWTPKRHICVEPHITYAKILQNAGYTVVKRTAQEFARTAISEGKLLEQVLLLDVVEHMTRFEAEQVIDDLAFQVHKQLVIYTPIGFTDNTNEDGGDGWGYDGQPWQEHKCGFEPSDSIFRGWRIEKYAKGFFGILTK